MKTWSKTENVMKITLRYMPSNLNEILDKKIDKSVNLVTYIIV